MYFLSYKNIQLHPENEYCVLFPLTNTKMRIQTYHLVIFVLSKWK